jgi:hypothetical protein
MTTKLTPSPNRQPIADPRTGRVTREWQQWFDRLYARAGGIETDTNAELAGAMDEAEADIAAVQTQVTVIQNDVAVEQLGLMAETGDAGIAEAVHYAAGLEMLGLFGHALPEAPEINLTTLDAATLNGYTAAQFVQDFQRDLTDLDVVNTTTETDVVSWSIPGGTLGTSGALILLCGAAYRNNSGAPADCTMRFSYGATNFAVLNFDANASHTTRRGMYLIAALTAQGATNAQVGWGFGGIGTTVGIAATSSPVTQRMAYHGTAAEDSTASKNLKLSAQHSAAGATISLLMQFAHVLRVA